MKSSLARFVSDYGMIFVLLLLCAFFSVATIHEQHPTGEAAARQLASAIPARFGKTARVLIVARNHPDDAVFAQRLERGLSASGAQVVAVVKGDPQDALATLVKIAASGGKLDVVAGTQVTGAWLVFSELKTDFPALGDPQVVKPQGNRWPTFLKSDNLLNIANQIAVIAIIAIGMTMVIITGGIDLSVGSLVALSAVLAARLIRDFGSGASASPAAMVFACLAAMAICGFVGAFSGSMITRFAMPPFIVTLAMMRIGKGLAYRLSAGESVYQIPDSFVWLGRGADLFGLPNAVVLMLVLYVLAHVMMTRMRLGRYLYAVGGNREAARLSGVPVERVTMFAYVACGMLAGLGGVILASQLKSGSPTYGDMYELDVITAVVVGGAPLTGGEGKMFGTLIGAFMIAVIKNGMNLMNIEHYTQHIVLGSIILVAVLIGQLRHR